MPPKSACQILPLDVKSEIESLISPLKGRGGRPGDLRLVCFPFIGN